MKLEDVIREYRDTHDLSQRQFAIACDLSNGYIAMLEKGENPKTRKPITPTLPQLKKLASGMNLSLTELFSLVDDIPVEINENKAAPENESGQISAIDLEIADLIVNLSPAKKQEALHYLRYLASREDI